MMVLQDDTSEENATAGFMHHSESLGIDVELGGRPGPDFVLAFDVANLFVGIFKYRYQLTMEEEK